MEIKQQADEEFGAIDRLDCEFLPERAQPLQFLLVWMS